MHAIKTYVLCFIYIHLLFLSFFSAKHTCKSKCLRSFVHLFVATTLKTKVWWMMTWWRVNEMMTRWPDDYNNVRLSCECGCWTAINRSLIRALSRLPGLWLVTGAVLHSGSHFVCSPTYQCQLESGREYKPPVFHIPLQHRAAHHGRLSSSARKVNFLLKYLRREKSTQNSNDQKGGPKVWFCLKLTMWI